MRCIGKILRRGIEVVVVIVRQETIFKSLVSTFGAQGLRMTVKLLWAELNPPTAAASSWVAVRRMLVSLFARASAGTANRTVAVPSVPASSSSVCGSTATMPRSSNAVRCRRTAAP